MNYNNFDFVTLFMYLFMWEKIWQDNTVFFYLYAEESVNNALNKMWHFEVERLK